MLAFLSVYHELRLAVKLLKVEDSSVLGIRNYAFLSIVAFGVYIGTMVASDEEPVFFLLVIDLIPLLFLIFGLRRIRKTYLKKETD